MKFTKRKWTLKNWQECRLMTVGCSKDAVNGREYYIRIEPHKDSLAVASLVMNREEADWIRLQLENYLLTYKD